MFGKVAKTVIGRSWGKPAQHAEAACGIAPLEAHPSSPRETFFELVEQVAADERMPAHLAMAKVRAEQPALFWSAFPQERKRAAKSSRAMRVHSSSRLHDIVAESARSEAVSDYVATVQARAQRLAAVA